MKKEWKKLVAIILLVALCMFGCASEEERLDELLALGQRYLQEENYEEAVVAFEKAIQIDEKSVEAYIGLGRAHTAMESWDQAERALETAFELDGTLEETCDLLIKVYEMQEKQEQIIATLEKYVELTGDEKKKEQLDQLTHVDFEIEEMYTKQVDVPDVLMLDVKIPKVKEAVKGAAAINKKIYADYRSILELQPEGYASLVTGFSYPAVEVNYELFEFGDVYQLVIKSRYYSALGSGAVTSISRYYYDNQNQKELNEDEFLAAIGFSKERIMQQWYAEYEEFLGDSVFEITYEEIEDRYYIDQNKEVSTFMAM